MRRTARAFVVGLVVLLVTVAVRAQSQPVRYIYDELGRLVGVIDQNGDAATYHYDPVGNLTSIARVSAGSVAIFEFSPNAAPVGTSLMLYGVGFSATPSQNSVSFNGTPASVTSATSTTLVVTVPVGATTGAISVTTASGSATTSSAFTVTTSMAPTITGYTPGTGVAPTSLTVSGTNFDTLPARTKVRVNGGLAVQSAITSSSVAVAVPAARASGRISVETPAGKAVATGDFIIPPASFTTSDVATSGRIAFNTATPVAVSTANKIALWLFDGTPGQRVSLRGTNGISGNVAGCDLAVTLLRPDNTAQGSACMEGSGFLDATTLLSADSYTLFVDPAGTLTGGVTLTLYNVPPDSSTTVTPGGAGVTVSTTVPGQNAVATFAGTAGQRVSLVGTSGMSGQVVGCDVNVGIFRPDGSVLAPPTCMELTGFIDVATLPVSGTYRVFIDPVSLATGSLTLTLKDVPADYTGSLTPGGSAVTVSTTTAGQNGALTFTGTAGQRISLVGTNGMSGQLIGCDVNVRILNPDSTVLAPNTCMESSGFIDVKTLPSTGTYTIEIDPLSTATGNLTLTLHNVPADPTTTISAGGSAVTVTTTTPGQNATVTFSATAGQRVSLSGSNGITGQIFFACDVSTSILKPDMSVLASPTCMEGTGFIDVQTLPSTGTYTILVDPQSTAVGSLTLTLHAVPADTSGTISVGGSAVSVPLSTPGQNGTLTFNGTASQQVTVRTTGNTFGSTTVKLLKPDGSQLTATTSSAQSFNLATQTLPTSGTYTIVVDPGGANTGTISISVTNP